MQKTPLKLAFWSLALDRSESCHFDDCAEAPDKSAPHSIACWNEQSWRLAAENVACPNRDSLKFPLRKSQPCRSSSSPFTPLKFRLGKDVCHSFNCRMSSSAVVGGGGAATIRAKRSGHPAVVGEIPSATCLPEPRADKQSDRSLHRKQVILLGIASQPRRS